MDRVGRSPPDEVKTVATPVGVALGLHERLDADCDGEPYLAERAAAFRRRGAAGGRRHRRARRHRGSPGEHGAAGLPAGEAGAEKADAFDEDMHRTRARPKTRLQLVPPKPNELLMTRRMCATSVALQIAAPQGRIERPGLRTAAA